MAIPGGGGRPRIPPFDGDPSSGGRPRVPSFNGDPGGDGGRPRAPQFDGDPGGRGGEGGVSEGHGGGAIDAEQFPQLSATMATPGDSARAWSPAGHSDAGKLHEIWELHQIQTQDSVSYEPLHQNVQTMDDQFCTQQSVVHENVHMQIDENKICEEEEGGEAYEDDNYSWWNEEQFDLVLEEEKIRKEDEEYAVILVERKRHREDQLLHYEGETDIEDIFFIEEDDDVLEQILAEQPVQKKVKRPGPTVNRHSQVDIPDIPDWAPSDDEKDEGFLREEDDDGFRHYLLCSQRKENQEQRSKSQGFEHQKGRRQEKRRKGKFEVPKPKSNSRMAIVTCSNCKLQGHKYTSCLLPLRHDLAIRKNNHKASRSMPPPGPEHAAAYSTTPRPSATTKPPVGSSTATEPPTGSSTAQRPSPVSRPSTARPAAPRAPFAAPRQAPAPEAPTTGAWAYFKAGANADVGRDAKDPPLARRSSSGPTC